LAIDLAATPLAALPSAANLTKLRADATRLPLADGCVDLLMAFQLLEHVPRSAALAILAEAGRVLRPGGRGFLTTPNARWRLLPGQRPWNPFHAVEWDVHPPLPGQGLRMGRTVGITLIGLSSNYDAYLQDLPQLDSSHA